VIGQPVPLSLKYPCLFVLRHTCLDDGDGFNGYIGVRAFIARGNTFHFIDDTVPLGDLSEYRVSPPLGCLGRMVQKIIIFHIDEELVCGAVGIRRTGHGNGISVVFQRQWGFSWAFVSYLQ